MAEAKSTPRLTLAIGVVERWRIAIGAFILLPLSLLSLQILHDKRVFVWEENFLVWLQKSLPTPLGHTLSFIFHIGNTESAAIVVIVTLAILAWKRRWREAGLMAIATAGVLALVDLMLKPFFSRDRPPFYDDVTIPAAGDSFPSGHATGNLVLYLLLAFFFSERFPKFTRYFYSAAIGFVLMVGLGSIYLGIHWPTDVMAGYGFGYLWQTICLLSYKLTAPKADLDLAANRVSEM
jgi:undecaprenyl-diphosphatase